MYDLTLIPIHNQQGQPHPHSAGFKAAAPPRRPARSRSDDLLILSLITQSDVEIPPEMQTAWLERLTQVFFKTSGSVTSALRSLIETLNLTLMEKNLKLAREGGWMTGAINLAAVHHRSLYLAQSGPTQAFTLTHDGLGHFHAPGQAERGLGVSRTPRIHYFQADLGTGGYLFMADSPPETWREDILLAGGFPSLETLQRRLLNQAPRDFRLDLVQIRAGEGHIQRQAPAAPSARPPAKPITPVEDPGADRQPSEPPLQAAEQPPAAQQDTREVQVSDPSKAPQSPLAGGKGTDDFPAEVNNPASEPDESALPESPMPETPSGRDANWEHSPALGGAAVEPEERPTKTPLKAKISADQLRKEGLKGLASFFDGWHAARKKMGGFFNALRKRWLPDQEGQRVQLSRGSLLWITLLVPILVAAIALGVYLSRGRRLQYDYYYSQAQAAAQTALAAQDPAEARGAWYETLDALSQADDIRDTDEVAALRQEAQDALDILDGALRLAYRPALANPLSAEINIREIISYGMDLYLLDDASGWVIHAVRENDVYEVDSDFLCAPGNYSGGSLDRIVDIVSLPINNPYQAHLLAIDALGSVAYCAPEQDPLVQALPEMSGAAAEGLRIAYENNTLYVLNPAMNFLWAYGAVNGQFLDPPSNYFEGAAEAEVPDLSQIVDFDVNGPELYLLRGDGSMVNCVFSGLPDNPVTCQNPAAYLDGRPGMEDQALSLPEGSYSTVFYTPPPTPLVNILDATHAEVFRFSLRFRLYQRLRPELGDYELGNAEATAFTIGEVEPLAFIAFGNQVFFAYVE